MENKAIELAGRANRALRELRAGLNADDTPEQLTFAEKVELARAFVAAADELMRHATRRD